jgi:hypothetical protein
MSISKGMTMIGSEEMMRNAACSEAAAGEPMPHGLTVARLEMMRTAIRPNVDAVEVIDELLGKEKMQPDLQHEMIIIFIGVGAVAQEVEIVAHPLPIVDVFKDDDAILHDGVIILMSDFRGEKDGSEVHKHEQLTGLELRPYQLIMLVLRKRISRCCRQRRRSCSSSAVISARSLCCNLL